MIKVIFSRSAGNPSLDGTSSIIIRTPFYRIRSATPVAVYPIALVATSGLQPFYYSVSEYKDAFVLRVSLTSAAASGKVFIEWRLDGDFNLDNFVISDIAYNRRIEVRNENDVLITDNGLPWEDGTYPPDAKNRAGLTGLHAAPAASTNEFADLSGLVPNKEAEIVESERGAGVKYALEKDEDNGL